MKEKLKTLFFKKIWIGGTICAIHKGLNGYHDWRRTKCAQNYKKQLFSPGFI